MLASTYPGSRSSVPQASLVSGQGLTASHEYEFKTVNTRNERSGVQDTGWRLIGEKSTRGIWQGINLLVGGSLLVHGTLLSEEVLRMTTQIASSSAGTGSTVTRRDSSWDYWNMTCNVSQLVWSLDVVCCKQFCPGPGSDLGETSSSSSW